ncbi:MAG: SulP family inorganic anion transporter [Bacteroidetes bacterium]|nr:SulP family inorganic anion transporter [Bacteroidota bacterium]MDA0943053.1 SulP family inorganic anion transporter [Bacteroidota bacterium]MDA1112428.1 SulP family inorganic anion transporter [Bacteroidota bacterium]
MSSARLKSDIFSSLVVFLVALPLCMGIALASGGTVIQGILSGVIGGLVIGLFSGSHTSVSGPAAGLITIVDGAIRDLGSMEVFATALFVAGLMQLVFGLLRGGILADFIPVSVIKGMLAAIGITLILKQLPHMVGHDADAFGEMEFSQLNGHNTFSELYYMLGSITPLAVVISLLGLAIQIVWERPSIKQSSWLSILPAPLLAVVIGVLVNEGAKVLDNTLDVTAFLGTWVIQGEHMVNVPQLLTNTSSAQGFLVSPDWSALIRFDVYKLALVMAIIASIESLLSIEAGDKLDPHKRISPPNKELFAQGLGNTIAGLLGALPVTAVIVRTSANISSGAATKKSAIFHAIWLLAFVLFAPEWINRIPLAALASVLIFVGYKLARPGLIQAQYQKGQSAFLPFIITIAAILLTDLLIGILIGLGVGFFFVLRTNYQKSFTKEVMGSEVKFVFSQQITFLNKAAMKASLNDVASHSHIILDFDHCHFVDADIVDIIVDFAAGCKERGISLEVQAGDNVQLLNIV